MIVREVVEALESIAPLSHAEPWDNVGLLVGDPSAEVTTVLLAIDCTRAVLAEAKREGAQMIVAYHPPIFDGQKRFLAGSIPFEAARSGVAIFSPHTALDVAEGGTNDVLADAVEMRDRTPLRTAPGATMGIGRVGSVRGTRGEIAARIKQALGLPQVLVAGPIDGAATRAAVCAGAGRDLLRDAIAARADVFVTGELPHHDALRATSAGLTVIALRHSASERATLPVVATRLGSLLPLRAIVSGEDHDPYAFA